ncbi:DUF896 domain-containing protein [Anaerotignum faecicola]|nr:DUF896 domain-containing protein [Anaerotignum faecicola]
MNENEELSVTSRINELAKKAKTVGLTKEEEAERDVLRREYINAFRQNLRSQLDRIEIVESDGSKSPLKKKK